MDRERITLSQMELNRIQVLEQSLGGLITTKHAALVLGLSERHVYRLKARLREHGPASFAHGNRGRKPAHTIPEDIRQQVVQLAQSKYWGVILLSLASCSTSMKVSL